MRRTVARGCTSFLLSVLICGALLSNPRAHAQDWQTAGKSIGAISTQGNLIVMELGEAALGKQNLFDLAGHTLRFTPESTGYRVEQMALQWDGDFGTELKESQVPLHGFSFPYSGKSWDSLSVGGTGVITFGAGERGQRDRATGGLPIDRFVQLGEAGHRLLNGLPAICVFLKPRMSGPRYVKETADRVLITWDLTEPYGNIQDFTWFKTPNRFQAVLRRDGSIDLSYEQVTAKDAVVGLYPTLNAGAERVLANVKHKPNAAVEASLGIRNVKVSVVNGVLLKVALEMGGPVVPEGEARPAAGTYRISFHKKVRAGSAANPADEVVWSVRAFGRRRSGPAGMPPPRYMAMGPGVLAAVEASGNTLAVQGTLPPELTGADPIEIQVVSQTQTPGAPSTTADQVPLRPVKLSGIQSPEVDLSALKRQDGPFPTLYESFHYYALPNPRDLACTAIQALGDKFDFLVYYSDFRVDNQEAGTPSTGPLGGGVTGIGETERGVETYCSKGRFQWEFIQPVYVGSNQTQEWPPANAPMGNTHDITFYQRQLGERSLDGKMLPYNYAMSQVAHELGHRWGAFVSAKVNGETIPLAPTHWARGLQAQVAFPYQRPIEASLMGGSVWQDNFDGTFTQLDDDYYVPASGWSYLDLYLMGLISPAEVPDFFILRNLVPAGRDANGHPIVKADRTKVTIQDVIAVEGPRLPDVEHSQRAFNTGVVVMVEHGKQPSRELLERANGIREQWIKHWAITTGQRSTMTTEPK